MVLQAKELGIIYCIRPHCGISVFIQFREHYTEFTGGIWGLGDG